MPRRVYLAQVNSRFGDNVHFPYSVGLLWSYFKLSGSAEEYELGGFLYHKDPIDEAVERLDAPDVLALSCYIWNFEWNKAFAKAVHEKWPDCVIVAGGPHIPDSPTVKDFHDFDFLIHGEGESPFRKLLEDGLDPTWVPGLSYVFHPDLDTVVTNPKGALPAPDDIPSPYLTGVFDDLLPKEQGWQAPQETHRGCAYRCTMCSWGSASMDKIRTFASARVEAEFEWFGKNKIEFIENADANYGLLARDLAMTQAMADVKQKYGYPRRFRAAFAKNSGERVFEISKILHKAGMHKATTVALQSLDSKVLVSIERKNIKFDGLSNLFTRYKDAGIPTYSELILGLPDESLGTFVKGVGDLLDAGQHDNVAIYNLVSLPNTPFTDPQYIQKHGIKTVPMQAMLLHAIPDPRVPTEIQHTVVETNAMSKEDWIRGWMFSWAVNTFHCLGLTQWMAKQFRKDMTYQDFYMRVLAHIKEHREYTRAKTLLENAIRGESWDLIDSKYGDITWPPDEFAFLNIVQDLDEFYKHLTFIPQSMIDYQKSLIVKPDVPLVDYAREVVWYGRKGANKRVLDPDVHPVVSSAL